MPTVYATQEDCKSKLGKKMQYWRAERPDEWTMDEFIRDVEKLDARIKELEDAGNKAAMHWSDAQCGFQSEELIEFREILGQYD